MYICRPCKYVITISRFILWIAAGLLISLILTWASLWVYENPRTPSWQVNLLAFPYFSRVQNTESGWMPLGDGASTEVWHAKVIYAGYDLPFQVRYVAWRHPDAPASEYAPGIIPQWANPQSVAGLDFIPGEKKLVQFSGWPWKAWKGTATANADYTETSVRHALASDRSAGFNSWDTLILFPLLPVFPGVLYNAATFGGVLFLIVLTFKHYRRRFTRWSRLSQLKCPNCKYNIRGLSVCPECGEKIDPEKLPAHLRRAQAACRPDASIDP